MDSHEEERPAKRFKHQSYKDTLRGVHLPSALNQSKFDNVIADNDSHFHEALDHWRELNLSPAFVKFARGADPLSASMPLLLHNCEAVIDLWLEALDGAEDEALKALLDLFQKLSHDLRTTLAPKYPTVLLHLIQLLPRSLSAPTLTALLATFSALFKYVLIPAVDAELLDQAWAVFRETLPRCDPEVQRATAEVWGAALRRLKASVREHCVQLIAASAESSLADACAWVYVSACKSVSQTLHTSTSSLFRPLLSYYLECGAPDMSYRLIRRVMTALIHHCKDSEQFSSVAGVVVEQFLQCAKAESGDADEERLRRILEVAAVACSVRQGSRMTHKQLLTMLSEFDKIPLTDALHSSVLKFTTSILLAGDMALWMASGRKVLERTWERPVLALEVCGALSDLGWGGWKMVAQPHVMKHTAELLQSRPHRMLELLVALHREKRLVGVDVVWKQRLQEWADRTFARWEQTEDNILLLHVALSLSSLIPTLSPILIRVIDATLQSPDPRQEYEQSFANSAWVLGACMQCLSMRQAVEWSNDVPLSSWTQVVVEKWNWSGVALGGLVALIRISDPTFHAITLDALYIHLRDSLLSHSHSLRLNVLRLFNSSLVSSPDGPAEVLKRSLQAEEVSLDVQGSRERVLRIGRLPMVVKDGDELGAEICCRWLIAQLKVNLRPLWSAAAQALAALSSRFGDLVWHLLFQEVQSTTRLQVDVVVPDWIKGRSSLEEEDDVWEDERSWRDPSAHKFRITSARWLNGEATKRALIQEQSTEDRFDPATYETQVLSTLCECSSLAEKHSRDLVPYFLSLAGPEVSSRLPRYKVSIWLTLFSKFVNPKALRSTETLRSIYIALLSHPDRALQRLALSCLLTYKSPHLAPHEDMLRGLLDDTKWREDLTQLDIAEVEQADRAELVDAITRLLFGMMLEKRGRSRGGDKRAAVLSALAGCTDEELSLLVDLMLQPLTPITELAEEGSHFTIRAVLDGVTEKQQIGFLNLLGDVLKHLGSRLTHKWPQLLQALIDLLSNAQRRLDSRKLETSDDVAEGEEEVEDEDVVEGSLKSTRTIRQLGIKRFADFFRSPVSYDFTPYMSESYRAFISPRLEKLDAENTQAPSALLELFHVWTLRAEHARFLVAYDDRTLPKVYDCLIATNVKPAVISRVFDIVERLLDLSSELEELRDAILKPHVPHLLTNISLLVERSKGIATVSDTLGRRQITVLSQIAPYLTDEKQASTLLELFFPLLRKPPKQVQEKVKADLLTIICSLFPLIPDITDASSRTFEKTFAALAQLFQTLRSRQARLSLLAAFRCLANLEPSIAQLADLMESLNAYSTKRIDEPDFDRRLTAFNSLNETLHRSLTSREWLPILYNMLNFIQDPEELTIRNNAAQAMKRFISAVAAAHVPELEALFTKTLYPGLKNGLRSRNEMVRSEILGVLSYAISICGQISALQEMRGLLANGDEEANFFNNVHHVQLHRRTRAIHRLADYCDEGHLRSTTLAEVFVPLIGNFIVAKASIDHTLVNESITATGRMARHLNWGAYYALTQTYLKLSSAKDESERVYVRALVAILDNFHFQMEEVVPDTAEEPERGGDHEDTVVDEETESTSVKVKDQMISRIADAVNHRLLPRLLQHLEKRDETEDTLRIPIAVGIIQVAKHLPRETREPQIARLLTVLSQIFRSKSQETRDLTRETLCRIAVILGPSYLSTAIKELRAALLRGPQLHVLAYVIHALLVHVTNGSHAALFDTLDDCVSDIAHVSAEVIFGESGKDVQAEEFKTKMREVRASTAKGLDSFMIMAKFITPAKISSLLLPIRNVLKETESLKVLQQVDELLRRVSNGLNANKHLVPTELLALCHTMISQNARFLKEAPQVRKKGKGGKRNDAIVQTKRKFDSEMDHYAVNSFRFVSFGLDLFITAHRRSRFDYEDPKVIARLEPMVATIGNTLYSEHIQVIIPGLKAAAAIIKCPLKSIVKSLPVFIRQMIDIIKQAGTTESEAVQMALKSLATILRDQSDAQVKEKDLVYLLELLSPDLEEPSRQAAVFTMLRAIVARKFVVPEIYDIMDKITEIMVTSQSPQAQEACRGVLLQFLLDYPQGRGRLQKQMTLLAKNLSYVHESGRKSVMELLSAIIAKFQVNLIREYSDLLFVALVMVVANDDSPKCREMASELIKSLFLRLADFQRNDLVSHLHVWAIKYTQPQLARVSLQISGNIIDLLQKDISPHVSFILEDLNEALRHGAQLLDSSAEADGDDVADDDLEWQISYHALIVSGKLLRAIPDLTTQQGKVNWPAVIEHLVFPHAWVRTASCRLLGVLFSSTAVSAPRNDLPSNSPFSRSGMEEVASKLCMQLRSPNLDAALSLQIVKNLFYVGKCFCAVEMLSVPETDTNDVAEQAIVADEHEDGLEDQEGGEVGVKDRKHPLPWLFSKLSFQVRNAHIARRNKSSSTDNWVHQPTSVLKWFAAMVSYMDSTQTERFLVHILSPVYRIIEDDTIRGAQMDELKTLATELQDLVQTKVGTTKFANVYNSIRQGVLGVRRERRNARVLQVTTNPEAAAKRKMHRNVLKKESRKRKNQVFADGKRGKRRRED